MAGTAGEEFCKTHNAKVSDLVAFLANARLGRVVFNKSYTKMTLCLRRGKKRVSVEIPVVDRDPRFKTFDLGDDWTEKLMMNLVRSFGLGYDWSSFRWPVSWGMKSSMVQEVKRRGGSSGFDLLDERIQDLLGSGEPQRKRDERKRQGELNRALAHLRKARKLGASARQMAKLTRTILAEEAVAEVQAA